MSRIVKTPNERITEIFETAEMLFEKKGYDATSINDIIDHIGIAKGTFYHYFKSKEQMLDAYIERKINMQIGKLADIVEDPSIDALKKFKIIILANVKIQSSNKFFLKFLHNQVNIGIHQINLVKSIKKYAPFVCKIIEQGNREGIFHVENPLETTEFLLVGANMLLDPGIFVWTKKEFRKKVFSISRIFESVLKAPEGSFDFINEQAENMYRYQYVR